MTEKKQPDYSSFQRYQNAMVAARFASSKNEDDLRHVSGALEALVGKGGMNLGEDGDGLLAGALKSKEGIQTAIGIYSGKFRKARGELSPADLIGWYSDVLSGLSEEESGRIVAYFGQYEESLGAIESKMGKASHIKNGEGTGANTEEELAVAEKTLQKYGTLMQVMSVLDTYQFENLRPNVVSMSRKEDLKGIASKLPEVASYKARAA